MADNVEFKFTGNAADAERAVAQLEAKYARLENSLKRMRQTSKDAAKEGASAFSEMAQGAGQLASNLTGVSSPLDLLSKGIQVVKAEYDDLIQRQEKAKNAHLSYAQVLEQVALNTRGDVTFNTLGKVEAEIQAISQRTGVDVETTARSVSTAASAKGQLPLQDAFQAVEAVQRLIPNLKEAQDLLSGVVLDVRKDIPQATPADVIGFSLMVGQQARITDVSKLAEHGLPAIGSMTKVDTAEFTDRVKSGQLNQEQATQKQVEALRQNAAVYSTLTQAMNDPQGRSPRTAAIALQLQLKEFLPELVGTSERIAFMQQNDAARKAFLYGGDFGGKKSKGLQMTVTGPDGEQMQVAADRASFERKAFPAIEALLTGGTKAAENLQTAFQAIPEITKGASVYETTRQDLGQSATLKIAEIDRRLQAQAGVTRLGDVAGAEAGATRAGLNANLEAAGLGFMDRFVAAREFDIRTMFGQSPVNAARSIVDNRLLTPGEAGYDAGEQPVFDFMKTDRRTGAALQAYQGVLDKIGQPDPQMQEQNALLKEIRDQLKKPTPQPTPQNPPRFNRNANVEGVR